MAEITKITTPIMPKENIGNKYKPETDQAAQLTDPSKVHKPAQEGKISDQQRQPGMEANLGRAAMAPLFQESVELMHIFLKMVSMMQMGISTAETMQAQELQELLRHLFVTPSELDELVQQQSDAAVLFKGEAFDALRDIMARFPQNSAIREQIALVLKTFEQNINVEKSLGTILANCYNLLDYMYTKDREQFRSYLDGLSEMLLPHGTEEQQVDRPLDGVGGGLPGAAAGTTAEEQTATLEGRTPGPNAPESGDVNRPGGAHGSGGTGGSGNAGASGGTAQAPQGTNPSGMPVGTNGLGEAAASAAPGAPYADAAPNGAHARTANTATGASLPMSDQREAASVLKNNLLPLLGEIVAKYNQNANIRDTVMVVVHNIVRVDQGTPEMLEKAVAELVRELQYVANLPEGFERNLLDSLVAAKKDVVNRPNTVVEQMIDIVNETLHSPDASPAELRQAELLLLSMLQNQSSLMNVLHFVLPILAPDGSQVVAELYVDPDSEERCKRGGADADSRKVFLSFDSERHGSFELSFLQTGEYVEFSMWCPEALMGAMQEQRRQFADMMMAHGFTMSRFEVEQFNGPHSVGEVFPALLRQKVGMDVRI